ncbi:MAG: HYR domain-containing protein [Saprospiraceae bacterium]
MIISFRSAFLGAVASFAVAGNCYASGTLSPDDAYTACPSLSPVTADYALCSGDHSTSLSAGTDGDSIDIEFVLFDSPQAGNAVYTGGMLLGTVSSANFSGDGPYVATLKNVVYPAVQSPTAFFVYARLRLGDPDLTDPLCRPFVEIQVTVNPLPVANAGADVAICASGSTVLSATGGVSCHWAPAIGLDDPNICSPTASPAVTTAYFVTVSNEFGCTASDNVVVSIHVPVAVSCNDNLLFSIGPGGSITITPDMILKGIDDGLDVYSVQVYTTAGIPVPNPLGCNYVGQTLRVKVTDTCTGSACWSTIRIEDKIAPLIPCKDTTLPCQIGDFSPAYLADTLGVAAGRPAVTDNCALADINYTDHWETVVCGDTIDGMTDISTYLLRKWTAADASGNVSSCQQRIYLKRRHVDDLFFPSDTTIVCTTALTDPAHTGAPYFSDFDRNFPVFPNAGACEINAIFSDEILPVCDGTYKIKRVWTVVDWCFSDSLSPNPVFYTQLIKVADTLGPVFACPADLTVSTDPFSCCAVADLPDVALSDMCSRLNNIGAMVATFDPDSGDQTGMFQIAGTLGDFSGNNPWDPDTLGIFGNTPCLPQGAHRVTYAAQDDCGNSATCSFTLTVADQTPPVAACDAHTQVSLGTNGMALVDASTFDDGSYDACNDIHFKVRRMDANDCQDHELLDDAVKFCCSDLGDTVTVVFRVYDNPPPAGPIPLDFDLQNFNECMVQVYVDDKLHPSCVAPADVTVSCESFDPTLETYGFATATDNCCLDTITETRNYNLFDTVCNKGTILRTFRSYDCAGLSNACTQRIVVEYIQDYWIKFPDDKIVQVCNGSTDFGGPIFYRQDCELLGVSYEDVIYNVVTDACYKIERTWNIINWCTYDPNKPCIEVPNPDLALERPFILPGPIVSPFGTTGGWAPTVVKILPTDSTETNYSIFWDPDANCYRYKQIIIVEDTKDPVISGCPATKLNLCDQTVNDPQQWNASYWFDPVTGGHDLCEGPVDLGLSATDLCTGANLIYRFLLFLDLDQDGIMETVVNSNDPPAPGTVNFGNAFNPNFSGGNPQEFDQRGVPASEKWKFAVRTSISGMQMSAALKWNTTANPNQFVTPQLPYGTHKIKWIVEDGCGNESVCEYTFVVKDCKAPTVVCSNGLSVNIMPTQIVQLWATDFLQYAEDNCTPPTPYTPGPNQLKFAVRKAGQGTGFPVDAMGNPVTNFSFTCAELGMQEVELWAQDLAGNADFCQTFVEINDNNAVCNPGSFVQVAGALKTEDQDGIEAANVQLQAGPLNLFGLTDDQGLFAFNSVPPSPCTLTPLKDDNPLNGVSTYDLVLISKHILGFEPLDSPYKMIAADANRSNSITTFDIVQLRKLILGIFSELPDNTSWRFVDKDYGFPQPDNPFATAFPETIAIADPANNTPKGDFIGIKIGDVNGSAIANALMPVEERTTGTVFFDIQDRPVSAGEIADVTFAANEPLEGFQFTLNLDGLSVADIPESSAAGPDHFGIFDDALTVSIDGANAFTVRFRAERSGKLSEMLHISNAVTRLEAYLEKDDIVPCGEIALRFNGMDGTTINSAGFEMFRNQPNPFSGHTTIGFFLPEASNVVMTLFDTEGKKLYSDSKWCEKGYHNRRMDGTQLGDGAGVLFCRLETSFGIITQKMLRISDKSGK